MNTYSPLIQRRQFYPQLKRTVHSVLSAGIWLLIFSLLLAPLTTVFAQGEPIVDGRLDSQYTFYKNVPLGITVDPLAPGTLYRYEGESLCYFAFVVDRAYNDNVYSRTANTYMAQAGWVDALNNPIARTLRELEHSDYARFYITHGAGESFLVDMDYLGWYSTNTNPGQREAYYQVDANGIPIIQSGTVQGGDAGDSYVPGAQPSPGVVEAATSLHWNILHSGWLALPATNDSVQTFLNQSPPFDYNDTPGQYWEWQMIYEWSIARSTLSNSCGDIDVVPETTLSGAHNSPAKVLGISTFAQIGDYVWLDSERDGLQNNLIPSDPGAGIGNVTVHLYKASDPDTPYRTTQTAPSGYYIFVNVEPGDYFIEFVPPAGYSFTVQNAGTDDTLDSDAAPATGRTTLFTVQAGDTQLYWDAGLYLAEPAITIEKLPDLQTLIAGETAQFSITVTNTGDLTLYNVTVTDALAPACDYIHPTELNIGQSFTYTCEAANVMQGFTNVAVVTGTTSTGTSVTDNDDAVVKVIPAAPAIDIVKLTNGQDANTPDTAVQLTVGDPVLWQYIVTNTGNVPLTQVTVTDNQGVTVTCPKTVLAVAESMTCTASGTATAGLYANIGTATGQHNATTVQDTDPSHYLAEPVIVAPGTLGDYVWLDSLTTGTPGQQDAGEAGIADVTVHLYTAGSVTPLATTTTDATGHYLFTDLPAGNYFIEFVPPADHEFTQSLAEGVPAAANSDADVVTGRTPVIELLPGQVDLTWDAGLLVIEGGGAELATLGDYVWLDTNGDGLQTPGEPGVAGVVVRLYTRTGGTGIFTGQTATTDASGFYLFSELEPGDYYVEFLLPAGYSFTTPNVGDNDTINSKATFPTLSLTLNAAGNEIRPGETMTYTLDYVNLGTRPAEGVMFSFELPEFTTLDPARNPGWVCPGGFIAGNTCTYLVGTLLPGTNMQSTLYLDIVKPIAELPVEITLSVEMWQSTDGLGFVTTLVEEASDLRHDAGLVLRQPSTASDEPVIIIRPPTDLPIGPQPQTNLPTLYLPVTNSGQHR